MTQSNTTKNITKHTLAGEFLLAMPNIGDARFDHTVIYLHEHTAQGAMGFVINQVSDDIVLSDIVASLDISIAEIRVDMPVFIGGPVETGRGFVLHDSGYKSPSTVTSADGEIGVTATLDVLEMLSSAHPLDNALTLLGYASWEPGQLEKELQENVWLICQFNRDLIFSIAPEHKYKAAMALMGINPAKLSSYSGSA